MYYATYLCIKLYDEFFCNNDAITTKLHVISFRVSNQSEFPESLKYAAFPFGKERKERIRKDSKRAETDKFRGKK